MNQAATSPWIRSREYDLSFIMGGALLTLMVPAMVGLQPLLLPVFFWIWLVFFEGSHFWASFSRTYIDKTFRRNNPGYLTGSLVFFIFPVLAVLYDRAVPGSRAIDLYGFSIFLWSLFHNARQHYGFVSIYNKKSGGSRTLQERYRTMIYFAVGASQLHFVFNHRAFLTFASFPRPTEMSTPELLLFHWLPLAVTVSTAVYIGVTALRTYRESGTRALVPAAYTAVCLIFYATMFYIVAPMEPFFTSHTNNAQLLMVIAIMNSLFHNIQYHAIVWHYGQKRYAETNAATQDFGIARFANAKITNYAGIALFFGAVFGVIVWLSGDWPAVSGATETTAFNPISYCLYFGIVGHHFFLDQKIWRPSVQKELRAYLDLPAHGVA
jgi:hypothetical protein